MSNVLPDFNVDEHRRKVYSQFDEDGITLELVRRLNPPHSFLEIGAGNGLENCTRILNEELRWSGVWIDADPANVATIIERNPAGVRAYCEKVKLTNTAWIKSLMPQEFGVLSIDIDGNDYHIWKALCSGEYGLKPAVCVIECQMLRPESGPWIMGYDEEYVWPHNNNECGANPDAMKALGYEMGYCFLGIPSGSVNAFFVRN